MNLPSYLKPYLKKFSSKESVKLYLVGLFVLVLSGELSAQSRHNLLQLRQEAENYLVTTYQKARPEKLEIKLGNWDRRISLSACQQKVAFSLQDSAGPGGNVTIGCECADSPGWTIHLPAQVDIYRSVVIANRSIARGEIIELDDLDLKIRNISNEDSVLARQEIAGKAAKRIINSGDVIKTTLLDQPKAVTRGENVTITAKSGIIQVVMQGTAMTDGKMGQQIRVKNNQSDRIISARVVGQAAVETL